MQPAAAAAPRSSAMQPYPQPPAETAGALSSTSGSGSGAPLLNARTHRDMLQRALHTLAASITQLKAKPTADEAAREGSARATPSMDAHTGLHAPPQVQPRMMHPSAPTAAAALPLDRKLAPVSLLSSSSAAGVAPPSSRPLAFSAFAPISPSKFPEALRWEESKEQAPALPIFAAQPHHQHTQQQRAYQPQQPQHQSRYMSSPSHALPLTTAALSPPRVSPSVHPSELSFVSHTSFLQHHPPPTGEPVFAARSKPDALFSQRAPSAYSTAGATRPHTSALLSRPSSAPFVPPYPSVATSSRPLSTTSSSGSTHVLSSFARTLQLQRQQLEMLDADEDLQRPLSAQQLRVTNIHAPVFSHPSSTRPSPVPSYMEGPAAHSATIRAASQPYSQPSHRARDHDREEELEAAEHERTLQRLRDALQQTRVAVAASERVSPVRSAAGTPSLPSHTAVPAHSASGASAPYRPLSRDPPSTNYLREYELKVPGATMTAARSPPKRVAATSTPSAFPSGPPAQPSALDQKIQSAQQRAERVLRQVDETLGGAKRRTASGQQPAAGSSTVASAKPTSPAPAINTWARMQAELERESAAPLHVGGVRSFGSNYVPPLASASAVVARLSPAKPSPFASPPDEAPARALLADYLQRGAEAEKLHQARMASYGSSSRPTSTSLGGDAAPPRRAEWTGAAAAAAAASVAAAAAAAAAAEAARETPPPRSSSVSSIRTPSPVHVAPTTITVTAVAAVRAVSPPPPAPAVVASPSHARVSSHTVSRVTDDAEAMAAPVSPAREPSSTVAVPASPIVSREDADDVGVAAVDEQSEEDSAVDDSFSRMDQQEQERAEQQERARAFQRPISPPQPIAQPVSRVVSPPKPHSPVAPAASSSVDASSSEIEEESFELVPSEPTSPAIAPVAAAAVSPPRVAPAEVAVERDLSPEPTRLSPVKQRGSPSMPLVAPLASTSAAFARSAEPSSAEVSFEESYGDVPAAASPVPEVSIAAPQRLSPPRAVVASTASLAAPVTASSSERGSPSSSLDVDHGSESHDGRSVAASDDVDAEAYESEEGAADAHPPRGGSSLFALASASTAEEFGWVEEADDDAEHQAQEEQQSKDEMSTPVIVSPVAQQTIEPQPQQSKPVDAESSLDVSVDSVHSEMARPAPAAVTPPSAGLSRFSPPLVQPRAPSPPQSQPAVASPYRVAAQAKPEPEPEVESDYEEEIEEDVDLNEEIEVEEPEEFGQKQSTDYSDAAPIVARAITPEPEPKFEPVVTAIQQPISSPAASDEYDSEFPEFSPEPQTPPKQQQEQQQQQSPPRSPPKPAEPVAASEAPQVQAPVSSADLSYEGEFDYESEHAVETQPQREPPVQQQSFQHASSSYEDEFGFEEPAAEPPSPKAAFVLTEDPIASQPEPAVAAVDEIPDEIEESVAEVPDEDEPVAVSAVPSQPTSAVTEEPVYAEPISSVEANISSAPAPFLSAAVDAEDEFPPETVAEDSSASAAKPDEVVAEEPVAAAVEVAAPSADVDAPSTDVDAHATDDSTVPAAADTTQVAAADAAQGYYDADNNWIDTSAAAATPAAQQPYYDEASGLYYDPASNCYWDDLQQLWVPWGSTADEATAAAAAAAEGTSTEQHASSHADGYEIAPEASQADAPLSTPVASALSAVDGLRDESDPLQFTASPLPPTTAASDVYAAEDDIPDEIEVEPELEFEAAESAAPSSADVSHEFSPKRAASSSGKGSAAPRELSAEAQEAADKRAADDARWAAEMKLIEDAQKVVDAEREAKRRLEQEQDEARRAQREQKRRDADERRKQEADAAEQAASAAAQAEQDARDAATEAEKARALAAEANDAELEDDIEEDIDDTGAAGARFTADDSLDESLLQSEKARKKDELVNAITMSLLQDLTRESLEQPVISPNAKAIKAKRAAAAAEAAKAATAAATADAPPPKTVSPHVRSNTLSSDLGNMDEYADDHLLDDDGPSPPTGTEATAPPPFHINLAGVTSGGVGGSAHASASASFEAGGGSSMTPIPSATAATPASPSTPERRHASGLLLHPSSASPPRSSLSSPTLSPRSSFPPQSRDDRALTKASKLELAGRARLGDKIAERGFLMSGSGTLLQEEARSLCSSSNNSPVVSPRLNQRAIMQRRGEYSEHASLSALPFDSPSRSSSGSGSSSPKILSPRSSGGASGGVSPRSSVWPGMSAASPQKTGADKIVAALTDDLLADAQAEASEVHRARRTAAASSGAPDTLESLESQSFDALPGESSSAGGDIYEISHEDLSAPTTAASKAHAASEAYDADSGLNTSGGGDYADEWATPEGSPKTTGVAAPSLDAHPLGAPLASSSSFLRSAAEEESEYADDDFVDQRALEASSVAAAIPAPVAPIAPLIAGIETSVGFVRKYVRTMLASAVDAGERSGASSSRICDEDVEAGGGYASIAPPSAAGFEKMESSRSYLKAAPSDAGAPAFPSELRAPAGSASPFPMAAQRSFNHLVWDATVEAIEAYRLHWSRQRAEPWFQHQRLLGTVLATATAASPSAEALEDADSTSMPRIRTQMRQVGMERGYALVAHESVPSRFDEPVSSTLRRIEIAVSQRVARMLELSRRTPTLGQAMSVAAAHVSALTAGSSGQSAPPTPANVKLPSMAASVTEHEMKIVAQALHRDKDHAAKSAPSRSDSPDPSLLDLSLDSSDEWEQLEPRESIRLVNDLADRLLSDLLVSTCSMLKSVHNKRSSTQFSETMSAHSASASRGAGSRANRRSPVSNKQTK